MFYSEDQLNNELIREIKNIINDSDGIIVGIGSGMSSSGGLNYLDPNFFKLNFPQFYKKGFSTIYEVMRDNWFLTENNVCKFWGYWANHINVVRYENPALKPYLDLKKLLNGKDYFICSTNVDSQLEKAGFKEDIIFAPQGRYDKFQCSLPCSDKAYDNEKMVKRMISNMDPDSLKIQKEDIPICPICANFLTLNLRKDDKFVEKPHLKNLKKYKDYINEFNDKKLVLLELGVGYDTPIIIRYPFEDIISNNKNSTLIRVNLNHSYVPDQIKDRSIAIASDIKYFLSKLLD